MSKRVLWEMSERDSDLLLETLEMDSQSNMFELSLRTSIAKALKRVKIHNKMKYNHQIIQIIKAINND